MIQYGPGSPFMWFEVKWMVSLIPAHDRSARGVKKNIMQILQHKILHLSGFVYKIL